MFLHSHDNGLRDCIKSWLRQQLRFGNPTVLRKITSIQKHQKLKITSILQHNANQQNKMLCCQNCNVLVFMHIILFTITPFVPKWLPYHPKFKIPKCLLDKQFGIQSFHYSFWKKEKPLGGRTITLGVREYQSKGSPPNLETHTKHNACAFLPWSPIHT